MASRTARVDFHVTIETLSATHKQYSNYPKGTSRNMVEAEARPIAFGLTRLIATLRSGNLGRTARNQVLNALLAKFRVRGHTTIETP
jgi:hypothetical protein